MGNSNINLTKTENIKFAYRLYRENTNYDKASKILRVSRRTYSRWVLDNIYIYLVELMPFVCL